MGSISEKPAWCTVGPLPVITAMSWMVALRYSQLAQTRSSGGADTVYSEQKKPSSRVYQSKPACASGTSTFRWSSRVGQPWRCR